MIQDFQHDHETPQLQGTSTLGPESFGLLADNSCPCAWGKPLTCGAKKISWLEEKNKINETNAPLLPQSALKPTHNTRNQHTVHPLIQHSQPSPFKTFMVQHWLSMQPPAQRGYRPSGSPAKATLSCPGADFAEEEQIREMKSLYVFLSAYR